MEKHLLKFLANSKFIWTKNFTPPGPLPRGSTPASRAVFFSLFFCLPPGECLLITKKMEQRQWMRNLFSRRRQNIFFFFCCVEQVCRKGKKRVGETHRKELHGWITQWPAVFCLIRSFTSAFLLPKSFMASRLSVGWNHACNWFLRKFDDVFSVIVGRLGSGSSFGVP